LSLAEFKRLDLPLFSHPSRSTVRLKQERRISTIQFSQTHPVIPSFVADVPILATALS